MYLADGKRLSLSHNPLPQRIYVWARTDAVPFLFPFFASICTQSKPPDSPLTIEIKSQMPDAHGVSDVNSVSWCPTEVGEGLLASGGDDGLVKVWRV
jgi:WD40 repeat protein